MLAVLTCLAWAFMLLFWGGFWRADQRLPAALPDPLPWPDVTILIPARNEAETIGEVAQAHAATGYPGKSRLFVIDDHSDDGTGQIATTASAEVVPAPDLQAGWSGKLWALQAGLEHADREAPDAEYLLLTDADILHDRETLGQLVRKAEADDLSLVSLMARLDSRGIWGALLIPAFVFFFQKLYPFPWINRSGFPLGAAAGGCILIRREALREIGDFHAIRDALIDDCTLAARIKHSGGRIWLGLADHEVVSLRDNRAFGSVWTMVRRTAFTQLRHSWILLLAAVVGMVFLYLVPVAALVAGLIDGSALNVGAGALAIVLMCIAYRPTLRLYGKPLVWTLTLPLAATIYTAMTVASALAHSRGRGGAWKGRTYL